MSSTYNYLGIELMATGENAGTWGTKTNTNLDIVQQAATGYHSQSLNLVGSGANTTALAVGNGDSSSTTDSLTNAARNAVIKLTGAITGNKIVTVPNTVNSVNFERLYLFENGTTGAYTVEIRTASGATQTGATFSTTDKGMKLMYCDGTQLYNTGFGAATSPGGSNTQVQFNNSGAFGGSANLTFDGTNLSIAGQGDLRLQDAAGGEYVALQAPATVASSITLTLPNNDGNADQVMTTDGSGNLSFTDVGGGISWQSSIVTAATHTAVAGEGYWIDTTSNACTITFPGSASVGDRIILTDYARKWATNNITINQNSLNFQGSSSVNPVYMIDGQSVDIVYSGATKGWIPNSDDDVTDESLTAVPAEYLVVAGGGGAGNSSNRAGGGGAGGLLTNFGGTEIDLLRGQVYTATVGDGGAAGGGSGTQGSSSSISGIGITTITSIGGGFSSGGAVGGDGGSGGGGFQNAAAGSGTVGQGNDGGAGHDPNPAGGGGGGGAGAAGGAAAGTGGAGDGGNGLANSITGSSVTYAGGGGGTLENASYSMGTGGSGGGGAGNNGSGTAGTANLGGGGGAGWSASGAGGKGIIILRLPTADYTGTITGSPTVSTDGTDTILTFNASGSYTA